MYSASHCKMQVLELLPRFERCVRSSQAEASGKDAEDTDDEDFAKGAARLFVELGEAYTTMVASGQYSQTRAESLDILAPVEQPTSMSTSSEQLSRRWRSIELL